MLPRTAALLRHSRIYVRLLPEELRALILKKPFRLRNPLSLA